MDVRQRIAFIDTAKAIGIVLVVLGHTPGFMVDAALLVYSFHMPLFFFISGYLLPVGRRSVPLTQVLAKNIRTLLIPYAFFFAISLLYWLVTRGIGDRAGKFAGVTVSDALWGFMTGLSADLFVNPALWFFPCLFVCASVYAVLSRRLSASWCLGVSVLIVAGLQLTLPWEKRLPLGLDIGFVALPFYAVGAALRNMDWTPARLSMRTVWVLLPVVALAWVLMALEERRVDFAFANFGEGFPWYFSTALLGIGLLLLVSVLLPHNRLVVWLADNSLIIFPLHPLLLNFASGLVKLLKVDGFRVNYEAVWAFMLVVVVIAACVPLAYVMRKYFSYFLGRAPLTLGSR